MKRFREFIVEDPKRLQTDKGEGVVDIENQSVREGINALLVQATACSSLTPYIALYKVMKVLASFHIHLPQTMLPGERGHKIFDVNQFGIKIGMNNDGQVVTSDSNEYKLYFEYDMNDRGMYDVYCQIVDEEELDEIEDDIEIEEQTVFEALSSFGQAYRNARIGNQGTFNWRGKSYDSELKTRPVNRSTAPQTSTTVPIAKSSPTSLETDSKAAPTKGVPLPRPNPVAQRTAVEKNVFGPPEPTATSTTKASAGNKSTLVHDDGGPKSTTANADAGPKATVVRAPEVPTPKPRPASAPQPQPAPSPNLKTDTAQSQPKTQLRRPASKIPEAPVEPTPQINTTPPIDRTPPPKPPSSAPKPAPAFDSEPDKPAPQPAPATPQASITPKLVPTTSYKGIEPNMPPPSSKDQGRVGQSPDGPYPKYSDTMDAEAAKAKEAQKNDITAGSNQQDKPEPPNPKVAIKEEFLSNTESRFTRMLKQRKG